MKKVTCVHILFCVVTDRNSSTEMTPDKVLFMSMGSTETEKSAGSFFQRWENRDAAALESRAAMDRNLLRYETFL